MRTITAKEALKGEEWAVVSDGKDGVHVYGTYRDRETAERITNTLNQHYAHAGFELAHVE